MSVPSFRAPRRGRDPVLLALAASAAAFTASCLGVVSDPAGIPTNGRPARGVAGNDGGATSDPGGGGDVSGRSGDAGNDAAGPTGTGTGATMPGPNGGYPAGWLYTSGNTIMLSAGATGSSWVGRGVNVDDLFLCGYNNTLYEANPDTLLNTLFTGLIQGWKPNFVRISLSMNSFQATSWLVNPAQYKTPMTNVINALGKNPGVYVLVALRTDVTMVEGDPQNKEATAIPSDATTTPDRTKYPTGTDAVYVALVDTFAHANFVLFGISNEPGGVVQSDATITAAMNHAVGTIRAEEDKLGVPHHVVSVQGSSYSSNLKAYAKTPAPITHDNVAYELHYYPGSAAMTPADYAVSSTLPLIVGEYGAFTTAVPQSTFYADMEAKKISSLAWDFEPFSNCSPDLLTVTGDASKLTPTPWGSTVKAYLTAH